MAITVDPVHFERLIELLKKKPIPVYYERKNSGIGRSLPFGIINRRNYKMGHSRNNKLFPEHYEEMLKIAKLLQIDCKWSSIMLNQNYKSLPHKDKNNDGMSCIVGFGDYTGGELNVEGTKYDIKHKPLHMLAGEQLHFTEPWEGDRYSIVFFRIKIFKNVKDKYKDMDFWQMNALLGEYDDAAINHRLD